MFYEYSLQRLNSWQNGACAGKYPTYYYYYYYIQNAGPLSCMNNCLWLELTPLRCQISSKFELSTSKWSHLIVFRSFLTRKVLSGLSICFPGRNKIPFQLEATFKRVGKKSLRNWLKSFSRELLRVAPERETNSSVQDISWGCSHAH